MNPSERAVKPAGAILAEVEIPIGAPLPSVWNAFVNESNEWWSKDFFTSKGPAKFVIDAKLGGHMYEDTGNGTGLIWFTILGLVPKEMIYAIGHMRPPFGGPASGLVTFTFEEASEAKTVFKVSDATFGYVTEDMIAAANDGWKTLFAGLKTYVEAR